MRVLKHISSSPAFEKVEPELSDADRATLNAMTEALLDAVTVCDDKMTASIEERGSSDVAEVRTGINHGHDSTSATAAQQPTAPTSASAATDSTSTTTAQQPTTPTSASAASASTTTALPTLDPEAKDAAEAEVAWRMKMRPLIQQRIQELEKLEAAERAKSIQRLVERLTATISAQSEKAKSNVEVQRLEPAPESTSTTSAQQPAVATASSAAIQPGSTMHLFGIT